jgi:predicted lipoprotein with Yx(FWY)xxD motif
MKGSLIYLSACATFAFAAAACGQAHTASSPAASHTASSPATSPAAGVVSSPRMSGVSSPRMSGQGTTISVESTRLGQVVVDGSGRTVYVFQADTSTQSTCYSACAQAWPPVITAGHPQTGSGASGALLGTTARKDGTTEVTYGGHPLYYFIADKKPGDMRGQGINQFGAKWYVLAPSGKKIDVG